MYFKSLALLVSAALLLPLTFSAPHDSASHETSGIVRRNYYWDPPVGMDTTKAPPPNGIITCNHGDTVEIGPMRDEIDSLWSRGNGSWLGPISTDWDRVACEDDVAINVCVVDKNRPQGLPNIILDPVTGKPDPGSDFGNNKTFLPALSYENMASITYSMLYNCSHQEFGQDPKTSDQVWTAKMEVDVENYYITYGNDHC